MTIRLPIYIALDVETGGIGEDKSLLTAYLAILDQNLDVLDELDLLTKPDDGTYVVQGEALRINGIDLAKHDLAAMSCKDASTKLYEFLNKNNPGGAIKLIPVGHNVAFDIKFLCAHTLSKKSWDKFCGYRTLDTGTISMFLMKTGKIPEMSASLGSLAKYCGIEFEAHTAKGDTLATVGVLREFLKK
jgi:DNA polymerase III epsilon subunit-like protein